MEYLVAIHKDPDSDYGVIVPDLAGCFSAGSTIDEAVEMIAEAMSLHIESMIEDGEPIPFPSKLEELMYEDEYTDAVWRLVSISEYFVVEGTTNFAVDQLVHKNSLTYVSSLKLANCDILETHGLSNSDMISNEVDFVNTQIQYCSYD